MIQPVRRDDELLADIDAGRTACDGQLRVWWLGQSGFLVQWDDRHLLVDPYLSDSLTHKYAGTDKPHVRMTARPIDPARLDMIDVVSSSHNHTDHLDRDTLIPLRAANPDLEMVIPEANRAFVADRLGTDPSWPVGLDHGTSAEIGDVGMTGVAVAHDDLEVDDHGRHRCLGYIVELGPFTLFHCGDAAPYEAMVDEVRRLCVRRLDIALVPINGRLPERRVPGNFWGDEAVALARAIGARLVVPMHYEMFTFNTEPPDLFERTAIDLGQPHRLLRCGECLTIARSPAWGATVRTDPKELTTWRR